MVECGPGTFVLVNHAEIGESVCVIVDDRESNLGRPAAGSNASGGITSLLRALHGPAWAAPAG